jgi:hypothetical protein
MSGENVQIESQKRRVEWLNRLLEEFQKIEQFMPIRFLPEGDHPAWVLRLEQELAKVMFPVARVRQGLEMTPAKVGAMLGHQCANAVQMIEFLNDPAIITKEKLRKIPLIKKIETTQMANHTLNIEKWYSAMRRLAKRALCSVVDQSYEDMCDFLKAFTEAFSKKPKDHTSVTLGSTNYDIYLFLMIYWQIVDQLGSVRKLHELLIKVFGPSRTGDQKRIEKMCQRLGKSFRKPGRPPLEDNSDKGSG